MNIRPHLVPALMAAVMLLLAGCVGSPIHSSLTYGGVKNTCKKNTQNLMRLKVGILQEEVRAIMGEPHRSEGYPWGFVWLYRTSMTKGIKGSIYGEVDADFTPVLFDTNNKLLGWGRNYYHQITQRYDIMMSNPD